MFPQIPFVTDKKQVLETSIKKAKQAGIDFIVFGGMTLKEGRQKDHYFKILSHYYPDLLAGYQAIYKGDKWGGASAQYYDGIHKTFYALANKYGIPIRIPPHLWSDLIDENDRVIVTLEHIDYLLKLKGQPTPYGYAAYSLSKLKEPITEMKQGLQELKGIGPTTEKFIREILETGKSSYYERLMGSHMPAGKKPNAAGKIQGCQ